MQVQQTPLGPCLARTHSEQEERPPLFPPPSDHHPRQNCIAILFSFTTAEGSTYEFQAYFDLKNWSKVQEVSGTGGEVKVTDLRKAIFQEQYYRVKLVE